MNKNYKKFKFLIFQVDPADAPQENKISFQFLQFATCTVHNYPLLLLLDSEFYTDAEVFKLLTKNIKKDKIGQN